MWIHKSFTCVLLIVTAYSSGVIADFSIASPNIPVSSLTLNGNGSVAATGIVLTLGEQQTSSVLYWNEIQDVLYGFSATVVSETSECDQDPDYLGGDGFALFVTTAISPTDILSTGGTLGLANKTNIAMAGLNFFTGELNFKTTRDSQLGLPATYYNVGAVDLVGTRCTGSPTTVQFIYTPPMIRISIPALDIDYSYDWQLAANFDAGSKLYVGLSGATGEAFMKQNVTQWQYTAIPPPEITPFLECYEKVDNNTYRAYMGYNNPSNNTVDSIANNGFVPDPRDRGQPQTFQAGRTPFYPLNAFSFTWSGSEVTWNLTTKSVTFSASNSAHLCPTSVQVSLRFFVGQNLTNAQINATVISIANFLGISVTRVNVQSFVLEPTQQVAVTKKSVLDNDFEATLELEIGAAGSDTSNEPSAAESVQKFVESTSNSTLINEVLNPPGSNTTIEFISVGVKATGAEGTGSLVSAAPVTPPVAAPVNEPTSMTPTSAPKSVSSATAISNSLSLLLCIVLVRTLRTT